MSQQDQSGRSVLPSLLSFAAFTSISTPIRDMLAPTHRQRSLGSSKTKHSTSRSSRKVDAHSDRNFSNFARSGSGQPCSSICCNNLNDIGRSRSSRHRLALDEKHKLCASDDGKPKPQNESCRKLGAEAFNARATKLSTTSVRNGRNSPEVQTESGDEVAAIPQIRAVLPRCR